MQIRTLCCLSVLPIALGLILTAPGQSAVAKAAHTKHHVRHVHSCAVHKCPKSGERDIVCTLMCEGSFKNLTSALKKAGLTGMLEEKGSFTVFAPDDKAFYKQRKGFMDDLTKDPKRLKSVLTYHVLPGKEMSSDLSNKRSAKTVEGSSVMIGTKGGSLEIDGALVTKPDIKCTNGVIHVIDDVLAPDRGK